MQKVGTQGRCLGVEGGVWSRTFDLHLLWMTLASPFPLEAKVSSLTKSTQDP